MKALRRELAIETTILRLVIAVQFAMLAPKIVYAHAAAHPDIGPSCKARANVVTLLPKKK